MRLPVTPYSKECLLLCLSGPTAGLCFASVRHHINVEAHLDILQELGITSARFDALVEARGGIARDRYCRSDGNAFLRFAPRVVSVRKGQRVHQVKLGVPQKTHRFVPLRAGALPREAETASDPGMLPATSARSAWHDWWLGAEGRGGWGRFMPRGAAHFCRHTLVGMSTEELGDERRRNRRGSSTVQPASNTTLPELDFGSQSHSGKLQQKHCGQQAT